MSKRALVGLFTLAVFSGGCMGGAFALAAFDWNGLRVSLGRTASTSLAIYEGWGWVTDARTVSLGSGRQVVRFSDVPKVERGFLSLPVEVLQSRFRYDLLHRDRLLERYAGKSVWVWLPHATESVQATLLWTDSGPMFKVGGRIYSEVSSYALPEQDLTTTPVLEWLVQGGPWSGVATASYPANGLSWQSEYSLTTDREQSRGDWQHWGAISNRTGADFRADITLVAGEVRRDHFPVPLAMRAETAAAPTFSAVPYAGRYQYRVGGLTLLRNVDERVRLGQKKGIPVLRAFRIESGLGGEPELPRKPRIRLALTLDRPVPRGRVTVLTPDRTGQLLVAGEPAIGDSPSGQPIILDLGEAFDLTVERKQLSQRLLGEAREFSYRLILRNQMERAATVEVLEQFYGDWRIAESSLPYEKLSATQALFRPSVPAKGTTTLTFRVIVKRENPLSSAPEGG